MYQSNQLRAVCLERWLTRHLGFSDFLISFFSHGFPLDKAIAYTKLRRPFCVNDLPMQKVLWDRRICLKILDAANVPTPRRLEVNRDGGPALASEELAEHVARISKVRIPVSNIGAAGPAPAPKRVELSEDCETLTVDGTSIQKPFVEKPISGEDHNIRIYFSKAGGGGGRRLFRKVGNKSSEYDPKLTIPRAVSEPESSYVYEQFLDVQTAEDVKAYTIGPDYCHAETRKSPVVDGLVRRNTHGKEIRYVTNLSKEEKRIARQVSIGFGQQVCGFDMLRAGSKSYVIDVNGWSFVKDNNDYYEKCASILRNMFMTFKTQPHGSITTPPEQEEYKEFTVPPPPVPSVRPGRKSTLGHRSLKDLLSRTPSATKLSNRAAVIPIESTGSGDRGSDKQARTSSAIPSPSRLPLSSEIYSSSPDAVNARASEPQFMDGFSRREENQSKEGNDLEASRANGQGQSWKMKGMVSVIRHADRTPKQKFKFNFHTKPFIDLLRGHREEVLLTGDSALRSVQDAIGVALGEGIEDQDKLRLLQSTLSKKGGLPGTKIQIKPLFKRKAITSDPHTVNEEGGPAESPKVGASMVRPTADVTQAASSGKDSSVNRDGGGSTDEKVVRKNPTRSDSLSGVTVSRTTAAEHNLVVEKLQVVLKWGGEPTHAARYQSQDLGENMRKDMLLMNREVVNNVTVFTSSERRVITSGRSNAYWLSNRGING